MEYTHASQNDLDFSPTSRRSTNDYSKVEISSPGSGGLEEIGMDNMAAPGWGDGINGSWRSTCHAIDGSIGWDLTVGHHAGGELKDYSMTGMEEPLDAAGSAVGSEDQRFRRPPEDDVVETASLDPYSSTELESSSSHFPFPENPTARIGKQSKSLGWQERNDDARAGEHPRQDVVESGANFRPSPCLLGGCGGAYIFNTLQSYRTHLKNVHDKSVFCLVGECIRSHTKPFNSENDRRRHHLAKHDPSKKKPFKCERQICPARVRAWNRKDKLAGHNKKYHMQIPCQICSRYFDNFQELSQHTNFDH